jgi:cell division protein FtsA
MAGYNVDRALFLWGLITQNPSGVVAVAVPSEISESVERVIDAARQYQSQLREIIHVRVYVVDGESEFVLIGMSEVYLEVETHITASAPALKNLTKTISEVGIEIRGIVFSALAASTTCLSKTEKELGCILVDIGAGTTSIAAFTDGSLSYSGAIPIGAKNVTNDLAIGLRVSLEEAEKIKMKLSSSKPGEDKKSTQIEILEESTGEKKKIYKGRYLKELFDRLNEIFTMVKLDLERTGIVNKVPSGIILTGGGALTAGAVESARRVLSLPVRIAKPKGVKGLVDDILEPPFAVPIGLLVYSAFGAFSSSSRPNVHS